MKPYFFLLFIIGFISPFIANAGKVKQLFRQEDSTNWYIYTRANGRSNADSVFKFENGMIHVSGKDFAYIITKEKFADFHLVLEFKWGEKKYPPRENEKRDGGILYHVDLYNGDKIWPRSLEYQIQEGDCGDFWMTDSTTIIVADTLTKPAPWFNLRKTQDAEKPHGEWNTAEVIVKNGQITHLLNGVVVNAAKLGNTKTGNIVLQSEGAELYYRNVRVSPN
jgi:hypothetical protein